MRRSAGRDPSLRTLAACRSAAQAGDFAAALAFAQRAIARWPTSADALFLAGLMSQRLGRLPEAIAYYQRSIRENGRSADAHHNLGCALLVLGRIDEGSAALRSALALRPAYPEALEALGYALAERGSFDEAAACYERALELDDRSSAGHLRLGNLLLRLGRYSEAYARFTTALERQPESAALHDGLGIALARTGRPERALAAYRRALACDPGYANAAFNLGHALIEAGALDEAATCFERAIAAEPGNPSFYLPLVTGGMTRLSAAQIEQLERLAGAAEALPRAQQIDLQFALANIYERAGRTADAFHRLLLGNALKRAEIGYDEAAALGYARSVEAAFGSPLMEQLRGCGDPSDRPIFIVGMPRSGSTLVEAVLAAHPAVTGGDEIGAAGAIVREIWPTIAASTLTELRAQIRAIGHRYLRDTGALLQRGTRLTDKTLENVQIVPLLHVMLPNARIVHVQRDPLDTAFSCFATSFAGRQVPFSYDLGELGRYYRVYLDLMERWRRFVAPGRLLEVRYEDLVADFEPQARRIIAFCGLEWDPACLAFHTVRRRVRTASSAQVRRPLYDSSIGRARPFADRLAPFAEALNGAS